MKSITKYVNEFTGEMFDTPIDAIESETSGNVPDVVYKYDIPRKTEFEVSRGITITCRPSGHMEVRVLAQTEWEDTVSLHITLPPAQIDVLRGIFVRSE